MATQRFWLDHNAGTPVDPRVLATFLAVERDCPGNPASGHQDGRQAAAVVEAARAAIAAVLRVEVDSVTFCSGGTEANNAAVAGLGDTALPVLLAPTEHPSVAVPARQRGIVAWSVDPEGRAVVTPPDRPVGLVCLVHAQSEVGAIQPVVAAAALAANLQVPLHIDAAQSLGRLPLDDLAAADSVTLSVHKSGGLRGCGVHIVRRRVAARFRPSMLGGGQELGRRAGTVSPSLAAATARAIELAVAETPARAARMAAAREAFVAALVAAGVPHRLLTPAASLPNTATVTFPGVDGRSLLPVLDLAGIAASHGAACASGSPQPPAILGAMGLDEASARATVRFSFGSEDDAQIGANSGACVAAAIARLRKKS